jgi:hypothetical protein
LEKLAELLTKFGYTRGTPRSNADLDKMLKSIKFDTESQQPLKLKLGNSWLDCGSADEHQKAVLGEKLGYLWIRSKKLWARKFCWIQPAESIFACLGKVITHTYTNNE